MVPNIIEDTFFRKGDKDIDPTPLYLERWWQEIRLTATIHQKNFYTLFRVCGRFYGLHSQMWLSLQHEGASELMNYVLGEYRHKCHELATEIAHEWHTQDPEKSRQNHRIVYGWADQNTGDTYDVTFQHSFLLIKDNESNVVVFDPIHVALVLSKDVSYSCGHFGIEFPYIDLVERARIPDSSAFRLPQNFITNYILPSQRKTYEFIDFILENRL